MAHDVGNYHCRTPADARPTVHQHSPLLLCLLLNEVQTLLQDVPQRCCIFWTVVQLEVQMTFERKVHSLVLTGAQTQHTLNVILKQTVWMSGIHTAQCH